MSILVCFALKEEAALFRKIAADKPDVAIIVTGIGRKNAEKSLREFLATHSPELVLTSGFAGGLNPDLKHGEVVFELIDRRGEFHEPPIEIESGARSVGPSESSSLQEKLLAAGAKPAKFYCADRIATTVAEKKKLRAETGADAVEMESWAIYTVCRERGIPYATVRVISDTANEDLPLDFNQLAKSDMHLHYGKLALAILLSPEKIGALLKLQKRTRFATEQLAEVLAKLI
jgi:adenosylhomocysteine nucleosidase